MLVLRSVKKYYPVRAGILRRQVGEVRAVDDVSFTVSRGETLGLVGESGCGKSTLGRMMVGLERPTAGSIHFSGEVIGSIGHAFPKYHRRLVQMIFQDPMESLNPRMSVGAILAEPFIVHRVCGSLEREKKVAELLERVGLKAEAAEKFPHEFSGGQRQRIGIARAIALNPELIICDEPVSNLDVSVQAQILNLLLQLQKDLGLTYIFIGHGLPVVRHMSDRIAVMEQGRIVELEDTAHLFANPQHPYTKKLLAAIPKSRRDVGAKVKDLSRAGEKSAADQSF